MLQHSLRLGQSGCAPGRRPCTLQQPCVKQARLATLVQALKGFGLPAVSNQKKNKCPCGSGSEYAVSGIAPCQLQRQADLLMAAAVLSFAAIVLQDCCQKLHKVQQLKPTSPEQLLRARFAAYVKKGDGGCSYSGRTSTGCRTYCSMYNSHLAAALLYGCLQTTSTFCAQRTAPTRPGKAAYPQPTLR